MKKLFLDDIRTPGVTSFEYLRLSHFSLTENKDLEAYKENDWIIVRNYKEFELFLVSNPMPDLISFDHDLEYQLVSEESLEGKKLYELNDYSIIDGNTYKFNFYEKTGLDCAKMLCDYCSKNNIKLPSFLIHSANPIGGMNIEAFLKNYKKHQDESNSGTYSQ